MPESLEQAKQRASAMVSPEARASMESAVSDKLSGIFSDGDDTLSEETPVVADETSTEEQEATAGATTATEEAETTETEAEPAPKEKAASEPAIKPTAVVKPVSTLPAAYVRSLKAYQWTDAEIATGEKADPAGFTRMAERVHAQRVQQTMEWANLGKTAKAAAPAATAAAEPVKFTPVDGKALRAKYGNEAFIDQMEAQSKALEYLQNQALPYIEQSRARQAEQELQTLNKSVDSFFGDAGMKEYHDHYGKAGSTLTDAQVTARLKVLETADLLVRGAKATGRPLTFDDAMTMAHDSVSSPIAAKVAVKKVQTQAVQRQASISVRPGSRNSTPAAKPNRSALESNVKSKLSTIFK